MSFLFSRFVLGVASLLSYTIYIFTCNLGVDYFNWWGLCGFQRLPELPALFVFPRFWLQPIIWLRKVRNKKTKRLVEPLNPKCFVPITKRMQLPAYQRSAGGEQLRPCGVPRAQRTAADFPGHHLALWNGKSGDFKGRRAKWFEFREGLCFLLMMIYDDQTIYILSVSVRVNYDCKHFIIFSIQSFKTIDVKWWGVFKGIDHISKGVQRCCPGPIEHSTLSHGA